ncbi:MAG TPA: mechanosensitive ion channel domain-containing protein, partial [Rhizorhapis sp.]|nr:mechanosensitive ion channel domain-containing protein [Rhizorhapis sp.]
MTRADLTIATPGTPLGALALIAAAIAAALLLHALAFWLMKRLIRRTRREDDDIVLCALQQPVRWLMVLLALGIVVEPLPLGDALERYWSVGSRMVLAAMVGWLAIAFTGALRQIVELRNDISVADNLQARRRRTRVAILHRITQFLIGFITLSMILIAIPGVRTIGVTLMASAGIAGLVLGAAAQPALKNLIAGIQMAFTEPIRIDDVVIVEGEWGRIEEIRLTYVVVRIWDDRRLVVPVSWFLEKPFQNWTRETSHLLGTVFFHVDPRADVGRIRRKIEEAAAANPRWDKRVAILQVTEHRAEALELRALLSARNAGDAFDLRCD